MGQRGGQALASVLILSESVLARGDVVLAGAAAAMALVWISLVADLKGLYLDVFRVALREGSLVVNSSQGGGVKDTWVVA